MPNPTSVRVALAVYRALARLLPPRFRARYQDEMERDLEAFLSGRRAAGGAGGTIWAGLVAALDLLRRVPVEWWATRRTGTRSPRGERTRPRRGRFVTGWGTDLRLLARGLARRPGYTLAATLTLGCGIGATVAIFTVVNGVLLRPLPFPDADRVVSLTHHAPGLGFAEIANSPGTIQLYRDEARFFASLAGYRRDAKNLAAGAEGGPGRARAERVRLVAAEPTIFDVLGVAPILGRPFGEADAAEGADPVLVLTHAAWRTRFAAAPDAIGRRVSLDGVPTEIVGVMPDGFWFGDDDAFALVPLPVDRGRAFWAFGMSAVARLAPGVDLEGGRASAEELQPRLLRSFGDVDAGFLERVGWAVTVERLQDRVVGRPARAAIEIVFGTVVFLLLVACANVANLFLVRAEGRRREWAVRAALGAGVGRLAGGLLVEGLALGALGGIVGVAISRAAVEILVATGPAALPRLAEVSVDGAAIAFAIGVSLLAGLALGALPLARGGAGSLAAGVRERGRGATEGRAGRRLRSALVAAQLALALVLLVGSGLMLRSFDRLRAVDPGFRTADVLVVGLASDEGTPALEAARFYQRALDEVGALPGVRGVALTARIPLGGGSATAGSFEVEGEVLPEGTPPPVGWVVPVAGDYAEVLGIPLLEGRTLERADWEEDRPVAVVNETFATAHLGGAPLGRELRFSEGDASPLRVVGVVGDVLEEDLRTPARPTVWIPMASSHHPSNLELVDLVVKSEAGAAVPPARIREIVERLDPDVPVVSTRRLDELIARSIAETSFTMVLLVLAAGMASFLGAIGLFAVVSWVVGQRTREIGVRVALGAAGADIGRLVLRQGAGVAAAGVLAGLVAALALTGLMRSVLFGVSATDPLSFAGAAALLIGVAAVATWLPARRAARVDPVVALRAE